MKKLLKIGELAKEAGITVRTLHHYDKIGLLQPTAARESGQRLYDLRDVERLQQVISLKSIGFSLNEIAKCLDEEAYDLQKTLSMQEEVILFKVKELQKNHQTLRIMLSRLRQDQNLTTKQLLSFIKEVKKMESLYTAEQLKRLKDRYEKYGPKKIKEVEDAWPVLFKKFEEAMNKGLAPENAEVQKLAAKAQEYIDMFTGGNKDIEATLDRSYAKNEASSFEKWGVKQNVFDYATKARKMFLKQRR